MPEISVEIEVYCSCGEGLCKQTTTGKTRNRGQEYFEVEPCTKCLDIARDKAYDEAYAKAREELENK